MLKIEVPARDQLKTKMDITISYRLDPKKTWFILKETGSVARLVRVVITPRARSVMRETGKTVIRSQDFFLEETQTRIQEVAYEKLVETLQPYGIIVENVLFRDITLPIIVTEAIESVKKRQEEVRKQRAELERVELQQKEQITKAKANLESSRLDAQARKIRADADAYANRIISKSLTPTLVEYNKILKWDGNLPRFMGSGSGVLLSVDEDAKK